MRFGRQSRLRLSRDFEFARRNSAKADCSAFVFYGARRPEAKDASDAFVVDVENGAIPRPAEPSARKKCGKPHLETPRFAVVASKRVGNAVCRNLAKRRLRAVFRTCAPMLEDNADVIVYVRRGFYTFPFEKLVKKFADAARRTNVAKIGTATPAERPEKI